MAVAWVPDEDTGLFCFEKRSVTDAIEPRRGRVSELGTEMGEDERSLDMVESNGRGQKWKRRKAAGRTRRPSPRDGTRMDEWAGSDAAMPLSVTKQGW